MRRPEETEDRLAAPSPGVPEIPFWLVVVLLAGLTLAMFADVLLAGGRVLSARKYDLFNQFVHWRQFGFEQLREGNLALWNPHLFCGQPYFGGFQSALLYPPNWLYMVLPPVAAVNWGIALHVFLVGLFMYMWVRYRRLHSLAALVAAVGLMFGGAYFLHIRGGHLPNLCTMVWAPLLLLAVDGLFRTRSPRWCLLGVLAVAMQVLAGHPQYVFYTGLIVGFYSMLCLIRAAQRLRVVAGLAGIYIGGAAIAAVQLLTGLDAAAQSARGAGTSYVFASSFYFAPENLLGLVGPHFFGLHFPGQEPPLQYWGRWLQPEMTLFLGVSGLALAVIGAVRGHRSQRRYSLAVAAAALVLALGAVTPLFDLLYHHVPGFDKFRGSSKFIFQATLFALMLVAVGLDHVIRTRRVRIAWPIGIFAAALVVGGAAMAVYTSANVPDLGGWWARALRAIPSMRGCLLHPAAYTSEAFVRRAGHFAARQLLWGAGVLALTAGLLLARRRRGKAAILLACLTAAELFVFARMSVTTFDYDQAQHPHVREFLAAHPDGDYRIVIMSNGSSAAMSLGAYDLWGDDPSVGLRYSELMAVTQNLHPRPGGHFDCQHFHRVFGMLRCRFGFPTIGDNVIVVRDRNGNLVACDAVRARPPVDVLERLVLVGRYRVLSGRDETLRALMRADFDPRRTVILDREPDPKPRAPVRGTARLVGSSTDHLSIEADLDAPAILLVTDGYARGWRAAALPGSAQASYEVLPANYVLRGIPLSAGKHRFRLEYLPRAFTIGKWISLVSVPAYVAVLIWWLASRRRSRRAGRARDRAHD